MDYSELSLEELHEHRKAIAAAIKDYPKRQQVEKLRELQKQAQEMGFEIGDLLSFKKYTVPPKWKKSPSETWTGRGRTPQWVVDICGTNKPERDAEGYIKELRQYECRRNGQPNLSEGEEDLTPNPSGMTFEDVWAAKSP